MSKEFELTADQMIDAVSSYMLRHGMISGGVPVTFRLLIHANPETQKYRYLVRLEDAGGCPDGPATVNIWKEREL